MLSSTPIEAGSCADDWLSGEEANHGHGNHPGTHVPDDEDAAPAGWIVMRVADDGMGIAPEELDQIFELYKQAGQSANRRYRGTGLGLAVVRDLTELHGGTVAVESRVKGGQHVHRAHSLCARH